MGLQCYAYSTQPNKGKNKRRKGCPIIINNQSYDLSSLGVEKWGHQRKRRSHHSPDEGLHHYEEFIDAGAAHHLCDDTAGRESHHITESESGAHESEQFRPGIPIETMKTGGG